MDKISKKHIIFLISLVLVLSTLYVFWQIRHHEFIDFDDNDYIYDNVHVLGGVTWENIVWAFTTGYIGNWHPLTWISHMLDYEFYGPVPGGHHLTSVFFHIANALLLFFVLNGMTGRLWSSAFVAAAFALHPLHVESVAWASERKDVLSTFFWMLTMAAYLRYVRRPDIRCYLLVILVFVLGLMSKSMVITLPIVLLLLDYWPLGRFREIRTKDEIDAQGSKSLIGASFWRVVYRLVREKIPFFVLSIVCGVITFFAQRGVELVKSTMEFPLIYRIENALVVYVVYMVKMFWPARLAIFYPHPFGGLPIWKIAGSGFLLVFVTALVIWKRRRYPYLLFGWLWYLVTLLPVIGLVQVGLQAMADRYTYIPLTGLFVIIAWGIPDILSRLPYRKIILSTSAVVLLSALGITSWFQVKHWRCNMTLYQHAVEVTENNYWAHYGVGRALNDQGRVAEAQKEFDKALQITIEHAIGKWQKQLESEPGEANFHLGLAMMWKGEYDDAIRYFNEALRIKSDWPEAYYYLGHTYHQQGNYEKAIENYNKALQLRPDYTDAIKSLKKALDRKEQSKSVR